MGTSLRLIILFSGLTFTISVIYLLMRKRMNEKSSLLWILGSLIVFILSVVPNILDNIATFIGVDYPPTLLFMVSTLVLMFICLMHSIQISILNNQVRELTQQLIINDFCEKDKTNTSSK